MHIFLLKYRTNIAWTSTAFVGFRSQIMNVQHVSRIVHMVGVLLWLLIHADPFHPCPLGPLPLQRRNMGVMASQITDNATVFQPLVWDDYKQDTKSAYCWPFAMRIDKCLTKDKYHGNSFHAFTSHAVWLVPDGSASFTNHMTLSSICWKTY